jgi:gluconokinase
VSSYTREFGNGAAIWPEHLQISGEFDGIWNDRATVWARVGPDEVRTSWTQPLVLTAPAPILVLTSTALSMHFLCFDISSGGVTTALLNSKLEPAKIVDRAWVLDADGQGAATLSAERLVQQFKQSVRVLNLGTSDSIDAICVGTFLHSCVVLDDAEQPLTPVFTWLDRLGETGLDDIRSKLGDRFHEITGCRYHPMFPVFKLATLRSTDPKLFGRAKRIVSTKALLLNRLTGAWVEDHGVASASGLFNITRGDWAVEILDVLGLERNFLPRVVRCTEIIGHVTSNAAREFGLPEGVAVVAGSGDGFLANMGSDCEIPSRIAVTLGTSAVARQLLPRSVMDFDAGTFCYRADEDRYLLGCAGSNGGNVLDWGRRVLGMHPEGSSSDVPIFIPLLHGERSPEWDAHLRGSWHGLTSRHTAADLSRSILEGVIFNLAHFVEIVQQTSGERATDLVISGNAFLTPMAAPMLAFLAAGISTWVPRAPGLASMRGAGICAMRAVGQPPPVLNVDRVPPLADSKILQRYAEYRRLRSAVK